MDMSKDLAKETVSAMILKPQKRDNPLVVKAVALLSLPEDRAPYYYARMALVDMIPHAVEVLSYEVTGKIVIIGLRFRYNEVSLRQWANFMVQSGSDVEVTWKAASAHVVWKFEV